MEATVEANDLLLFARVADAGSFSRAAERLSLPKSTVSRRVAALEAQLGERLLLRTTRKLSVTDFGRSVLDHAHQVAEEVEPQRRSRCSARPSRVAAARVDTAISQPRVQRLFADFIGRTAIALRGRACRRGGSTSSASFVWRSAWATARRRLLAAAARPWSADF
jgi:DNA-binding transcriptional LysR family regulator